MIKIILFTLLFTLLTGCAKHHTDWAYKNENPYKAKFKFKPNYEDWNYGHRPGQTERHHEKKTKIRY